MGKLVDRVWSHRRRLRSGYSDASAPLDTNAEGGDGSTGVPFSQVEPRPGRVGEQPPAAAPRWFVPTLVVVCGLLLITTVVGQVADIAPGQNPVAFLDFPLVASITFTLVGGIVIPRQPRNPVGWLFLAIGLSSALGVLFNSFFFTARLFWFPVVSYGLLPLVLLVFPDGRLPSRSWRPVAWIAAVCLSVAAVSIAVPAWDDPTLQSRADIWLWITWSSLFGIFATAVAAVGSLVVRWRRSEGDVRQQLKWLGLGSVFIPIGIVLQAVGVSWMWVLPATTVPAAAAVAILKYRLYDIAFFLNRSLVYATLTVLVVGGYVGIVAALSAIFPTDSEWERIAATGVIAMAFGPLRERVQRSANRLLYGDRDDPYTVVSQLGQRLAQAVDPTAVLPGVAETVAQVLQLPYVAIELTDRANGPRLVASHGRQINDPEAFAMTYQGQVVGRLLATPRSPAQSFSTSECNLLEDLARQAGLAAHAVSLTVDLQRSRERLVRSREEERRRLRRDLHDGLGPTLAGMTMQIGAARALLTVDIGKVETVLGELERQLQSCTKEIRQLIEDLRPSTLDHLGLIGAIRHYICAVTTVPGESGVEVVLTATGNLENLSAAVEVAAYRIVTEAISNTVRHAAATRCDVRLTLQNGLLVEITDNGIGLPENYQTGVGLTSMRERAEELGGTFTAQRRSQGGSSIRALLPLRVS